MKRLAFLFLTFCTCINASAQNTDIDLLRKINVHRNKSFDCTFEIITNTATPLSAAIPGGLIVTGLITKDKKVLYNGFESAAAWVITSGITGVMKYTIKRPRPFKTYPDIIKLSDGGSPSFPSGHTSVTFSTATSLSLMYPKWYVITPAMIWAVSVGYSRMHLGVHYPSDVLVGAVIGSGAAFLCYKGRQWLKIDEK